jgi:hypothetical protein
MFAFLVDDYSFFSRTGADTAVMKSSPERLKLGRNDNGFSN